MWGLFLIVLIVVIFYKINTLSKKVNLLEDEVRKHLTGVDGAEGKKEILSPGADLQGIAPEKTSAVTPPEITYPVPVRLEGEKETGEVLPSHAEDKKTLKHLLNLERIIGERYLVWVGALILAAGLAFFVKHAFEQGWISASARIILGFMAGFIFIGFGEFLYKKRYDSLAQGISALGFILFYLTTFTAYHFYNLLGAGFAFILFLLTAVGGMSVAVYHNALPMAFLSMVGAFAVPLLLADPTVVVYYEPKLFSYLLVINLGVLYSSAIKRWRTLSFYSFLLTAFYFWGWYLQQYMLSDFPLALTFAVIYFLTFSLISTIYSILRKGNSMWEDVILVILNPAVFFILIHNMLVDRGITGILPWVPTLMAFYHFILAAVVRRINVYDRFLYLALTGTAIGLLTLPVPIIVKRYWITTVWGAEALALIVAGSFLNRKTMRTGGLSILALVVCRLVFLDAAIPYWRIDGSFLFFNLKFISLFLSACTLGLAGILFGRLKNVASEERGYPPVLFPLFATGLFWIMNLEIFSYFSGFERPLSDAKWVVTSVLWSLFGYFFFTAGILGKRFVLRKTGFLFLLAASLKWLLVDTVFLYNNPYGYPFGHPFILSFRFLPLLFLLVIVAGSARLYAAGGLEADEDREGMVPALWIIFVALLFIGLNIEVVAFLGRSSNLSVRALSFIFTTILWAAFSFFLFLIGFKEKIPLFRTLGIVLVTASFIKVLVDIYFVSPFSYGYLFLLNLRFFSAGAVLFALAYAASLYRCEEIEKLELERKAVPYLWSLFLLLLFVELNVQSFSSFSRIWNLAEEKMAAALSFLWVFYGFCLLLIGIIRKIMPLRIAALSLFGATLIKVLFFDMRFVDKFYKMLLLLGIGTILLSGAFFYRKYRRTLQDKNR